ncbi:MAG TPA: hypothetical protein VNL69_01105 [Bacteroidota bacterium]|nr:hypothetical protein [Bacteroidota bacterium]
MSAEERHWTDDSDLIERFVLNRLDPDERNELEDHLRVCEVCKQALRAEQILIVGIRRSGRERLKAELRKKLIAAERKGVPWPHILSAAAVVIILLGIAYYNRWFEILKSPEREIPVDFSETATPAERAEEAPPSAIREQPPKESEPSVTAAPKTPPAIAGKTERTAKKQTQPTAIEQRGVPTADALVGVESESREETAFSTLRDREIWLQGELLEPAYAPQGAPAEHQHDVLKREAHRPIVIIEQQRLDALPEARRHGVHPQPAGNIPSLLRMRGDTLLVTMYVEELMDAGVLEKATIERPGGDMLIVSLPDRRIAYRLPEGWLTREH